MNLSSALITIIIGTRPEAIKLAPVIKELKSRNNSNIRVILTGQHKELVYEVLNIFSIEFDHNLELMSKNQSLNHITLKTLEGLQKEFTDFPPNLVIVQGDTTTAFTAALAAFYKKIIVAHVEAGLRTDDIYDPFPEEVNRRLISQIASLHFTPTEKSKNNLIKSNTQGEIAITGNTVIDSLLITAKKNTKFFLIDSDNRFILVTVHRRENRGEKLQNIARSILSIVEKHQDIYFLIPMHPSPEVRASFKETLDNHPRIKLTEPLNYIEMVSAIKQCYFVMTDSGGIQEEAPSLGKPVLVLRDTTERPEGIDSGTAKLIGTNSSKIILEADRLLSNSDVYTKMSKAVNPYGDGKASMRIVSICEKELENL